MIQHWFYLLALLIPIAALLLTDYRFKLAFWYDARRTTWTISVTMALFIIWDLIGIHVSIFFKGASQYMLPVVIVPDFPFEELFFLFLLAYVTLLLYRGAGQWRRIS